MPNLDEVIVKGGKVWILICALSSVVKSLAVLTIITYGIVCAIKLPTGLLITCNDWPVVSNVFNIQNKKGVVVVVVVVAVSHIQRNGCQLDKTV